MRTARGVFEQIDGILERYGASIVDRTAVATLIMERDEEWVREVKRMFRDWYWSDAGPPRHSENPYPPESKFLDRLECLKLGQTHYDGRGE